jgi:hypothetical protein
MSWSVDRVETAVWVLSDTGKWGRLGELPIPLIGSAARIIDGRLVVAGSAPPAREARPPHLTTCREWLTGEGKGDVSSS